jgi:4-aminobutyrate aminotransferase / (S)-3-amino-2-methylpropionate transaminase / 5-aminovalerate transaminase
MTAGPSGAPTGANAQTTQPCVPAAYRCAHPIIAARGEGAWIVDTEGRRYLDFGCGIGVTTLGHGHPRIVAAAHEQLDRLIHSGPVILHDQYIRLAARLSARVPGPRHWQALLLNSGSEATENAVKIARYATGRNAVIAFEGAWHGRTLLASALTGKAVPNKRQPGPLVADVFHAPYCDTYRPPAGVEPARAVEHALGRLQDLVHSSVPPDKVAAVIIEPLQGEGGFIVPPVEFMAGVAAFARQIGALLVMDEVQTGYGRTGTFFAYEQYGIEPDVIVIGKAIAGGLPLAGVLAPD